jgi:hypothetical protein
MQEGKENKKREKKRRKKKKKNRHRPNRVNIYLFCSPFFFFSRPVESAHITSNSTRHVCTLVIFYFIESNSKYDQESSEKKKTERREVSNKHGITIEIFSSFLSRYMYIDQFLSICQIRTKK